MSQQRIDLTQLSDQFLTCRTIGHAWHPRITVVAENTTMYRWEVLLDCTRCESERADLVDSQGRMVGRAYRYARDYGTIPYKEYGGIGLFKAEARRALFDRLAQQGGQPATPRRRRRT